MENVENQQNLKRKISLEEDFMDHSRGNDLLYGFMINQATFDPETKQLYLTKYRYGKLRPVLKAFFCEKGRTYVSDNLKKLIENGLIKEGHIDTPTSNHVQCYLFPNSDAKKYKLIDNDMIIYVVHTRNMCAVRIYTYLLNKYEWKKKSGEDYVFTIRELREALGWAPNSRSCDRLIKDNLESFCREGIIRLAKGYEVNEDNIPCPRLYLKFVAGKYNQLPVLNEEYVKKIQELNGTI